MTDETELVEGQTHAGPFDAQALADIEGRHQLDSSFRLLLDRVHGGVPIKQFIKGHRCRIGRFLTIFNKRSQLTGAFQPHFDQSDTDCRIVRSIAALIDSECATSRGLFYGQRLLPFAALYAGENHPDEMCLDRAYVDLLCFDYGTGSPRPPIVIWHAEEGAEAYEDWLGDDCPQDEANPEAAAVDYDKFTKRVADNFDEFLKMLQSQPQ